VIAALALAAALAVQDTVPARLAPQAADSVAVLDFPSFYRQVAERHPVARQAELLEARARAEVLAARAPLWDPVLAADWTRKAFASAGYYNYLDAALKLPTPVGVEFKLGYERARGRFVNPDRLTPPDGLWVAGVTIPIGQGMLTDERRTALTRAVALGDLAVADRQAIVNKLLFSAAKDYADWYEAWRRLGVAREGLELADTRYRWVQRRFEDGDAAAIDTVEAGLELQRRLVTLLESENAWFVTTQVLNTYLWDERATPVDLAPGVVPTLAGLAPSARDTTSVDGWLARALERHPDLLKALAYQRVAEADRRLYKQELLPDLALEAAFLKDGATSPFQSWAPVEGNYKFNATGKTSLLLMKERGALGAANAKLETAQLDVTLARRDIRAAVLGSANDVFTFQRILGTQNDAVRSARFLRDGEVRRFEEGESTLFLVNQRDRLLLDESIKLAAYEAKYVGARAALAVALGVPSLDAMR
jgi:outer membrane protein TolC